MPLFCMAQAFQGALQVGSRQGKLLLECTLAVRMIKIRLCCDLVPFLVAVLTGTLLELSQHSQPCAMHSGLQVAMLKLASSCIEQRHSLCLRLTSGPVPWSAPDELAGCPSKI